MLSTHPTLTPAGRLRQGFRFQDLLALEKMMDWLFNSQRFQWIVVEADDGGFLDDVQCLRSDGVLELWQVKFSINPNNLRDAWTWKTLLKQENGAGGPKLSLLQKWCNTWSTAADKQTVEASLLSNRQASGEFENCFFPRATSHRTVNWDAIPTEIQQTISAQLGGEVRARSFLTAFRWRLTEPHLPELERLVFEKFERLGGTSSGWYRLWVAATQWIENKDVPTPNGHISLDSIREAAGLRQHTIQLHTFLPPSAFFAPYLKDGRLFHHRSPLVGRRKELQELRNFWENPSQRIAILPGRGGNGKSRLIRALCKRLVQREPELPIRIVIENAKISEASLQELQNEKCLIIVDDAHRDNGINNLLRAAREYSNLKVLLICRPYGTEVLFNQVQQASFDTNEIRRFDLLRNLNHRQLMQLAKLTLGRDLSYLTQQLVTVTGDSPFLTVLGGQLLRAHQIPPALLIQNNEFRHEVLKRLKDNTLTKFLATMDGRFSEDLCSRVLPYIAVCTPLDLTNKTLLQKVAELTNTDRPTLLALLEALESSGLLFRGGRYTRIVPDVLSDYILQEACFLRSGVPTGWADTAFSALFKTELEPLLRNLAELDWRVRSELSSSRSGHSTNGDGATALAHIWETIEEQFQNGNLEQRLQWLQILERSAFTHPTPIKKIIEIAMFGELRSDEDGESTEFRHMLKLTTENEVRVACVPLLKAIARHQGFAAECCELLWTLNQSTVGPESDRNLQAISVLDDIASYRVAKPLVFQQILITSCRKWLEESDSSEKQHAIWSLVRRILERIPGSRSRQETYVSTTSPSTSELWWRTLFQLRREALKLVAEWANTMDANLVIRCLDCLKPAVSEDGLHEFNRIDDERAQAIRKLWENEQLTAISLVQTITSSTEDPFVKLAAKDILQAQGNGVRNEVVERARISFESIGESFEMSFVRAFAQSRFQLSRRNWRTGDLHDQNQQELMQENTALCEEVANEFVATYPDSAQGFQVLETWRIRIGESLWWKGIGSGSNHGMWTLQNDFIVMLTHLHPDYAYNLCLIAVTNPEAEAVHCCTDVISVLRRTAPDRAAELSEALVNSAHPILCYQVAESFGFFYNHVPPTAREWPIIETLFHSENLAVKARAIKIIGSIAASNSRKAVDLALGIDIGSSSEVADSLFHALEVQNHFDFGVLRPDELTVLIDKLLYVESLDSYHVGRFLREALLIEPLKVVEMLLQRIRFNGVVPKNEIFTRDDEDGEFRAGILFSRSRDSVLPEHGFDLSTAEKVVNHSDYLATLKAIRDASMLKFNRDYRAKEARLYRDLSFEWNQISLDVLEEWVKSNDGEKILAATRMLEFTFVGFYVEKISFISTLLNAAFDNSLSIFEQVSNKLFHFAVYGPPGVAASRVGEVSNMLVDNARKALEDPELDEVTRGFFLKIEAEGMQRLQQESADRETESVFFHH